ncbi:MAG: tRNA uridine-5-carboxymethylaminomethyl(34) synthesis GTPase MnmE [Candidatus Amulumruptor caecigallinarius]|nr:tRNA uridine-5-carboxymethylaminomethyl(34) synthesis GTPase MnmE [Candidatus Amulumruptor caecigallinarius]MCM1395887.1 tRNA uridine-5-carboxymethylaminomethyl(34) synthesis GTPase MnmE [Candidatus Amulumruptor caecigallinarius]MCM1452922.1 tRNA uridine-5-carboxymethylaminomethyl(34) synthesis GTPase MnmE [bacterium]
MNPSDTAADTICAISTPPGRGGIAVVRISGPAAVTVTDSIWRGKPLSEVESHTAHLGAIIDTDGTELDQCMATVFRSPRSYTGEDTVELSLHGSPYIQREALKALIHAGARMAEPGEFTRRAFINGRLDLTQAEGVADVIAADTAAQHKLAQSQLKGAFSARIHSLHDRLLELASLLELELDFSEEDVEFASRQQLIALAEEIIHEIDTLTESYATGVAVKEGIPVAIIGTPNAGKSTLLNQLLSDDVAIVSDIPGTTRDTIEGTTLIGGTLFRFIDTAGLRRTTDIVEQLGIDRAAAKARDAAIIIWLIDPTATRELTSEVSERLIQLLNTSHPTPTIITLLGKHDLIADTKESVSNHEHQILITSEPATPPHILPETETLATPQKATPYSSREPQTLAALKRRLSEIAKVNYAPSEVTVTNIRHYESLIRARSSAAEAREALIANIPADLVAQSLRATLRHLATLTGAITTPTLLTAIFTRFCIGK